MENSINQLEPELMPLKIPTGWGIIYNNGFFDVDVVLDSKGKIVNWECFKEDLLNISKIKSVENNWVIDENYYYIDLGWYPDSDPKGEYILRIINGFDDNVTTKYSSKNRFEIQYVINLFLKYPDKFNKAAFDLFEIVKEKFSH